MMTTIVVLTLCVVADSRRLRPLRRSLTSLSFVSSLVLSFLSSDGGLSFHHTRGRRHTVVRARARISTRMTVYSPLSPSNPANPRGPSYLSLLLSRLIEYTAFSLGNECAGTARPTAAVPLADAYTGALDRACGYTGFAATATVVSVYVSVGEKWEMGHATRALVGRERVRQRVGHASVSPRFLRGPPSSRAPSLLSASDVLCVFSLFLLHSLHRSQPLIRESCTSPSPSITRDTLVSRAIHVRRVSSDLRKDFTLASLPFGKHVYL